MIEEQKNTALLRLDGNRHCLTSVDISSDRQYADPRIPKRALSITDINSYFQLIKFETEKNIMSITYECCNSPLLDFETTIYAVYPNIESDSDDDDEHDLESIMFIIGTDHDVLEIRDKINRYEYVKRRQRNVSHIKKRRRKFFYPNVVCKRVLVFDDYLNEQDAQIIDDWGELAN